MQSKIVPVILSGGAGTRLWPSSRNAFPKQFLPLVDATSTFSNTLARIPTGDIFAPPLIVTGWDFRFLVADEIARAGMQGRIILEPVRRDSCPAIAAAAFVAHADDPDAVLLVLAADHYVEDVEGFVASVSAGIAAASGGHIVTFGVTPSKPATQYGYIEPGEAIDRDARRLCRFLEKPDAETAATLIKSGCVWNSGNFLFKASVFLQELAVHAPDMYAATQASCQQRRIEASAGMSFEALDADAFTRAPSGSVDVIVMEKTKRGAVVTADYGWSDLGSWEALWEHNSKDAQGNVVFGTATLLKATNSYVSSEGVHTAIVGLDNLTVVATQDAVLVAPRHVAADLKPLVAMLESQDSTRLLTRQHMRVRHSWGWEHTLVQRDDLTIRQISLRKGASVPVRQLLRQQLVLHVMHGRCAAVINSRGVDLEQGQNVTLQYGDEYSVSNGGQADLELVEIRTGLRAEQHA